MESVPVAGNRLFYGHLPVADRLMPLAKPLLAAWYDEPYDYLGQRFSEQKCAIDRMGQVMTPIWLVSHINDSVIERVEEDRESVCARSTTITTRASASTLRATTGIALRGVVGDR